ncbi:MAG: molybdenum cofactor guanylyltransferase [Candidatus Methanoperedens sp.]|nr:molybdenum cofactor guanylyltransferase [Candidatus Methanoperedens sp.]MCE8425093.1 molybdenum cofactor guanylyltransferase [Candidatus Methanoperedens sp.]MCE8427748.1 molybdenum cofactor guanylyltransferase [Candidatus Methanoperedens sp.]
MKHQIMTYSSLILAGGKGSRMSYQEKALIDINGRPLITYVIDSLLKAVDNIIISVRDDAQGELLAPHVQKYEFAYDSYENTGPLSGILSGLLACEDEYCFIVACDMPFINEKVVKLLFKETEDHEAALPRWSDGFVEPLHAVYQCKPMIRETKRAIESGENIILAPISRLKVNYVNVENIKELDPQLKTFINVNTPEDIEKIKRNLSIKYVH